MESQRSENTSAVTQVVVPEMLVEGHVKKQCNVILVVCAMEPDVI